MDTQKLSQLATQFVQELPVSKDLQDHVADHQRRSRRAQAYLTAARIPTLTEIELRELFFDSDALSFWSNKDWEFNNRLQKRGLEGLRQNLLELITRASQGLQTADLKQVLAKGGIGLLLSTELLAYHFPLRYWTYSPSVTLPIFRILGEDIKATMPHGEKSDPYIYLALESRLVQVRQALTAAGESNVDNLLADIFLWWVKQGGKAITPGLTANAWIFQANPQIYDLPHGLQHERLNDWHVSRYRPEYQVGDNAVFWKAGKDRGVYGLGKIVSAPYQDSGGDWVVDLEYQGRLAKPIYYDSLVQHPVLSGMLIMRQQQGTNFRVSSEEWTSLGPLLGEVIPPDADAVDARESAQESKLDRKSEASARRIIENLLPNPAQRQTALNLLADYIECAHGANHAGWGVTLYPNLVRLNVGKTQLFVIRNRKIYLLLNSRSLKQGDKAKLKAHGETLLEKYDSLTDVYDARFADDELSTVRDLIATAFPPLVKQASLARRTSFYKAHSPGIIEYLRQTLGRPIPQPEYSLPDIPLGEDPLPAPIQLGLVLQQTLAQAQLHFTPWQIAAFYTALQAKPFAILSGISGTGKTKLAQHLAALFPQPVEAFESPNEVVSITIQPYMLKYGRLIVPKQSTKLFDPPAPGQTQEVNLSFDGNQLACRLVHAAYGDNDYLSLLFRGTARQWFTRTFTEGDTLFLEPELDREQNLTGFRLTNATPAGQSSPDKTGQNWLFLPVRPDWRDSKSLLGYFNPLTSNYEWTPFLRFLQRAVQSYQAGDGLAWFVILDEMNLAHVEYYFADLLSVLESGRDKAGWTREPLRFAFPDEAEGDLPPRELRLPPNLYLIGTVNVDETTHAFSPKVLDRAFTLELTEADFSTYLLAEAEAPELSDDTRQALLESFTFAGQFTYSGRNDKPAIQDILASEPAVRTRLQILNTLLRPHNLHFGYRVFDEICWFLNAAKQNQLFEGLAQFEAAFDAAVLMKVLPKFHGSRGKLEAPLRAVLAWCIDPDAPTEQAITDAVDQMDVDDPALEALRHMNYRYSCTADRAIRMLAALYADGFAAFG